MTWMGSFLPIVILSSFSLPHLCVKLATLRLYLRVSAFQCNNTRCQQMTPLATHFRYLNAKTVV